MDILEAYRVFLSRYWSRKLQGYFSMDWSQLWILYKGRNKNIRVNSERYMNHNVTPLNGNNEPVDFTELIFGNCFQETKLECYLAQPSLVPLET